MSESKPPYPKNQISRRALFGKMASIAALVAVAAIPKINPTEPCSDNARNPPPVPFGPPERTKTISEWESRFDETIVHLERYWTFLNEAKSNAPESIDLHHMMTLELAARDAMESLLTLMDDTGFDVLSRALTGRSPTVAYLTWAIRNPADNERTDPEGTKAFWLREIEHHPDDYAQLRAVVDEVYG